MALAGAQHYTHKSGRQRRFYLVYKCVCPFCLLLQLCLNILLSNIKVISSSLKAQSLRSCYVSRLSCVIASAVCAHIYCFSLTSLLSVRWCKNKLQWKSLRLVIHKPHVFKRHSRSTCFNTSIAGIFGESCLTTFWETSLLLIAVYSRDTDLGDDALRCFHRFKMLLPCHQPWNQFVFLSTSSCLYCSAYFKPLVSVHWACTQF